MTQPLALVFYENLLPGTQLVNRLQDLGYRVRVAASAMTLVAQAEQEKPMLVLADLRSRNADLCQVIRELRGKPSTEHIPVLAFLAKSDDKMQEAARSAGATMVALEDAILPQLPQLLARVLEVE